MDKGKKQQIAEGWGFKRKIGLVIGTNNYTDPGIGKLDFAEDDAKAIKDILLDPNICEFDKVIDVIGKSYIEASKEIEKILMDAERDDFILFYFSGYGRFDMQRNLYFLFTDTKRDTLFSTSLPFDFINRCIENSKCKTILIILDSSYSGAAVKASVTGYSGTGIIILSASTEFEAAREDKNLKHGVLTHYLLEGLQTGAADLDADGLISIEELYDYVYSKITERWPQKPMLFRRAVEGKVFIGKNPKLTVKIKERKRIDEEKWITRLELEKELISLDTKGFESEVSSIKSKLKSPSKVPEIEREISELKLKIYETKRIDELIEEGKPPVVQEGTREKHIFKLKIGSPDTIEIASDKGNPGVYYVRLITPLYSSRPKSTDVGKDLLEYINASIDAVTAAMNKVRGIRGDEEERIEDYSIEMLGLLRDLGCILYKQILPPDIIRELSEHQKIKPLELSISEDLGECPWEAMHDDADIDSFLCLNYALGRSIQVEGTLESPTGIIGDKLKALVIGDPLEGCERELPMAKKEAEEVAKKLRERGVEVKTLIGESATLPKVLPELGRGYDIIHYAGHAEFDTEKPRDSYLILRDEMHLKAKNITKQFEGKKKPIFAYINACKAGKRAEHEEKVEDIEYTNDVSGLASAFLEKGIYYIGSVWPIHDDASADAAIYFYDNFLKGVSIGESLRKAKVGVYEKYKGKRTAWAGLVLYGNPTLTIVSG